MAAKLFLLAFGALALIPGATSVLWSRGAPEEVSRTVELDGPFAAFSQTRERIQMRLVPARHEDERSARTRILVRDRDGDELTIPLRRGQTWASAELPANLASADELRISLQD